MSSWSCIKQAQLNKRSAAENDSSSGININIDINVSKHGRHTVVIQKYINLTYPLLLSYCPPQILYLDLSCGAKMATLVISLKTKAVNTDISLWDLAEIAE